VTTDDIGALTGQDPVIPNGGQTALAAAAFVTDRRSAARV
jgi:hypothetical protein